MHLGNFRILDACVGQCSLLASRLHSFDIGKVKEERSPGGRERRLACVEGKYTVGGLDGTR